MPGLNHVDPGGKPLTLALSPALSMTKLSVGPMDNNAYLLRSGPSSSGAASLLVDAAAEASRLLALTGPDLSTIVTTHRHGDHWSALNEVADRTGAALVAGRPDVDAIATGAWVEGLSGVWDGDLVAVRGGRVGEGENAAVCGHAGQAVERPGPAGRGVLEPVRA